MSIEVRIHLNVGAKPEGKLADAEIHFLEGELTGLKLVGFGVWQRRDRSGRSVSFPSRPFVIHGDRRNFTLLRPIDDPNAEGHLRDLVLRAYEAEVFPAEAVS